MKRTSTIVALGAALALALAMTLPTGATPSPQTVDLGAGDGGLGLIGWSNPISTIGGGYGGLFGPNNGDCDAYDDFGGDQDGRAVWEPSGLNTATVTMSPDGLANAVTLCHLDGIADDSMAVDVLDAYGQWQQVGTYTDKDTLHCTSSWNCLGNSELWFLDTYSFASVSIDPGPVTIRVTATAPGGAWIGQSTWGQLAIDYMHLSFDSFDDFVNVGTPDSEGARLSGSWGPIEPDTHGGNWGSMGSGNCGVTHSGGVPIGPACDGKTRVIWEQGTYDWSGYVAGSRAAKVTLDNSNSSSELVVRYLDGLADDSFDVQVQSASKRWYILGTVVGGEEDGIEDWHVATFDLSKDFRDRDIDLGDTVTVKFRATGDAWVGHPTWGQVAIDWVALA